MSSARYEVGSESVRLVGCCIPDVIPVAEWLLAEMVGWYPEGICATHWVPYPTWGRWRGRGPVWALGSKYQLLEPNQKGPAMSKTRCSWAEDLKGQI